MPYGEPIFFKGEYIKDSSYPLFVIAIKCQFKLKENHLPTIQIKNSRFFAENEYVESSEGESVSMVLTSVDYELFFKHYDVWDVEYNGGWKFKSYNGFFKDYIDKWYKIKQQATMEGNAGMRTLSKLMLNSLYGKFASAPTGKSKIPYYEDRVKYAMGPLENRKALYIPIGSFITAWARYTTITAAQKLYDRFCYADTDSLHLLGTDIPTEIDVDPTKLGAWKHESTFTRARFLRSKSYIEEIDGELKITCAGLPKRCHQFVTWDNFLPGNSFQGKLIPKHVDGGIVLAETEFTLRK